MTNEFQVSAVIFRDVQLYENIQVLVYTVHFENKLKVAQLRMKLHLELFCLFLSEVCRGRSSTDLDKVTKIKEKAARDDHAGMLKIPQVFKKKKSVNNVISFT